MRTRGVAVLAAATLSLTGCSSDGEGGGATADGGSSTTFSSTSTSSARTSPASSSAADTASPSASSTTVPGTRTGETPTQRTGPTGRTTEPGPKPPTDARPQDCTFATALGSAPGKTLKGVTCKAAQEVWRRYLALPPDPGAGNTNHRELDDGWVCYAPTAGTAVAQDEGGICERQGQQQKFILRYTQD